MDQVITYSNLREGIIITGTVALKKIRQVEGWFGQQAHTDQVKRNHQAANTTITVQKGVYGLELVVANGKSHQMRDNNFLIMPELLKIPHQFGYALLMWRNERSIS